MSGDQATTAKNDAKETAASDGESSSDSEVDDTELEKRRERHVSEMILREKEFAALKEKLKEMRLRQIERRSKAVQQRTATDLIQRLKDIEADKQTALKQADEWFALRCECINEQLAADNYAAERDLENDLLLAKQRVLQRIENEIARLRKEKYESDVAFALWMSRRNSPIPQERSRRRRHRAPDGPYIVYNLTEEQIDEDVSVLKRAAIEAKVSLSERGDNDVIYLRDVVTQ